MTVLVACEESGTFRDALLARGIDAVSCDLKPTSKPGPHIVGDALDQIGRRWRAVIAFPVCKYLTNAGAKHLYIGGRKENGRHEPRWLALEAGVAFYAAFRKANATLIAIENPIWHAHAAAMLGHPSRRFCQPWWFGEPAFKATGWELHGLPHLRPTNRLTPPKPGTTEHKAWSWVHRCPPSKNREEIRSKAFPGMAAAAAEQWALGLAARMCA